MFTLTLSSPASTRTIAYHTDIFPLINTSLVSKTSAIVNPDALCLYNDFQVLLPLWHTSKPFIPKISGWSDEYASHLGNYDKSLIWLPVNGCGSVSSKQSLIQDF